VPAVRTRWRRGRSRDGLREDAGRARDAVEAAAGRCARWKRKSCRIESSLAPLRERINELRLKEQAAQINYDQYDTQLREAEQRRASWRRRPRARRGRRRCRVRSRA
jgi:predicted  nucleic acid-binding Zn-ribbon protein